MALVLFVLCSAFFHFASTSSRLRAFNYSNESYHLDVARQFCQNITSQMITLYDDDDELFARKSIGPAATSWIGLRHNRTNTTTWSDNSSYVFTLTNVSLDRGSQLCEAIDGKNWTSYNCSERKPFMCSKNNSHVVFKEEKTWCQALQHCRRLGKDLVSISTDAENERVTNMTTVKSFWIGLLHDEWEWEDKGCSTFRELKTKQDEECAVLSIHELSSAGCDNDMRVFCSKGSVRIKVIREKLTWEQALDYCLAKHTQLLWIESEGDQEAVKEWLRILQVDGPFWIGLRQSRIFGFWFWSSDWTVGYDNWKGGAPPELPMSHHCGAVDPQDNYQWVDRDCRLELPFLCEEDILIM